MGESEDSAHEQQMQLLLERLLDSKKSNVITGQKFDDIVQHLKHPEDIKIDAYFKHWIHKERQFRITDLPGLGLKDVLVCPARLKKEVNIHRCTCRILSTFVYVNENRPTNKLLLFHSAYCCSCIGKLNLVTLFHCRLCMPYVTVRSRKYWRNLAISLYLITEQLRQSNG